VGIVCVASVLMGFGASGQYACSGLNTLYSSTWQYACSKVNTKYSSTWAVCLPLFQHNVQQHVGSMLAASSTPCTAAHGQHACSKVNAKYSSTWAVYLQQSQHNIQQRMGSVLQLQHYTLQVIRSMLEAASSCWTTATLELRAAAL
jgi:hypothetical protein